VATPEGSEARERARCALQAARVELETSVTEADIADPVLFNLRVTVTTAAAGCRWQPVRERAEIRWRAST
jgi:hypothetical protein